MRVFLIRHGKSESNLANTFGEDPNLCEEGIRQSLSAKFDFTPNIVISGALKRQIQTAENLFPDLYKHETYSLLNEMYFGSLEGTLITPEFDESIIEDVLTLKNKYGGDNMWERADKALEFIKELGIKYKNKTVAIVTSDTLMQAMMCTLKYGHENGHIYTGELYVDNCESIEMIEEEGNICALFYKGKNILEKERY